MLSVEENSAVEPLEEDEPGDGSGADGCLLLQAAGEADEGRQLLLCQYPGWNLK